MFFFICTRKNNNKKNNNSDKYYLSDKYTEKIELPEKQFIPNKYQKNNLGMIGRKW